MRSRLVSDANPIASFPTRVRPNSGSNSIRRCGSVDRVPSEAITDCQKALKNQLANRLSQLEQLAMDSRILAETGQEIISRETQNKLSPLVAVPPNNDEPGQ